MSNKPEVCNGGILISGDILHSGKKYIYDHVFSNEDEFIAVYNQKRRPIIGLLKDRDSGKEQMVRYVDSTTGIEKVDVKINSRSTIKVDLCNVLANVDVSNGVQSVEFVSKEFAVKKIGQRDPASGTQSESSRPISQFLPRDILNIVGDLQPWLQWDGTDQSSEPWWKSRRNIRLAITGPTLPNKFPDEMRQLQIQYVLEEHKQELNLTKTKLHALRVSETSSELELLLPSTLRRLELRGHIRISQDLKRACPNLTHLVMYDGEWSGHPLRLGPSIRSVVWRGNAKPFDIATALADADKLEHIDVGAKFKELDPYYYAGEAPGTLTRFKHLRSVVVYGECLLPDSVQSLRIELLDLFEHHDGSVRTPLPLPPELEDLHIVHTTGFPDNMSLDWLPRSLTSLRLPASSFGDCAFDSHDFASRFPKLTRLHIGCLRTPDVITFPNTLEDLWIPTEFGIDRYKIPDNVTKLTSMSRAGISQEKAFEVLKNIRELHTTPTTLMSLNDSENSIKIATMFIYDVLGEIETMKEALKSGVVSEVETLGISRSGRCARDRRFDTLTIYLENLKNLKSLTLDGYVNVDGWPEDRIYDQVTMIFPNANDAWDHVPPAKHVRIITGKSIYEIYEKVKEGLSPSITIEPYRRDFSSVFPACEYKHAPSRRVAAEWDGEEIDRDYDVLDRKFS